MEFSFLDLLASTALNESNLNPNSSDFKHKDNPNTQAPDNGGDDETVGKTSTLSAKDIVVLRTFCARGNNMGSVKYGAKKKPVNKTVVKSIFVRDGKCVAKEVSAALVNQGKYGNCNALTGLTSVSLIDNLTVSNKLESLDVCSSPKGLPQSEMEAVTDTEPEAKSDCACSSEKEETRMVQLENNKGTILTNGEMPVDQPEDDLNFFVAPAIMDHVPVIGSTEAMQNDVKLQAEPLASAALAAAASGALEVAKLFKKPPDETNCNASHAVRGKRAFMPEKDESQSCDGESHYLVSTLKDNVHFSDPSMTMQDCEPKNGMFYHTSALSSLQRSSPLSSSHSQSLLSSSSSQSAETSMKLEVRDSNMSSDQPIKSTENNLTEQSSQSLLTMLSLPSTQPTLPETFLINSIHLDHCYYSLTAKLPLGPIKTDDGSDGQESVDETTSVDDVERRPHSLSVDSLYLQNGGLTAASSPLDGVSQTERLALFSPASSVDSVSDSSVSDLSNDLAGGYFYSILAGSRTPSRLPSFHAKSFFLDDANCDLASGTDKPSQLGSSLLPSGTGRKFQIGNFGSFSNSLLDLKNDAKNKLKIVSGESALKHSMSSPALVASQGSPFPLIQSPGMEWDRSDAGSETPDDAESSTTEDRFLGSSLDSDCMGSMVGLIWHHPVFHDHDYFCKEVSEKLGKPKPAPLQVKNNRRKQPKKKERQMAEDKGKYLKMELLKQDNRFNLSMKGNSKAYAQRFPCSLDLRCTKPNPVGRPRRRSEKPVDYDSDTGTKMKITGKYQDQYVYYYSKTSRNRRRKFEEKGLSDKILVPTPKPGDIVVPHLTDADCEAIKKGGRAAFKVGALPVSNMCTLPSATATLEQPELMDSSIVNTILSMENDSHWVPQPNPHDGEFDGFTSKLTTEQVDLLIDCLQQCDTVSSDLTNFLATTDPVPLTTNALDSTAATAEEDFLSSGLPLAVSSAGCLSATVSPSNQPPTDEIIEEKSKKDDVHSVEKNLEFLTKDFYTPISSVSSTNVVVDFEHLVPDTEFSAVESVADVPADNVTPWIVTVTLYYNDIPAIIINNRPYVRLVDIHKQILPAKDTGILKKRCQLMKIPVMNCSEMQRYFLVQYGRAQNSKSTLVITKDEAGHLISYYAQPQPRNLRNDEPAIAASDLRGTSGMEDTHTNTGSHSNTSSPVPPLMRRRKRGLKGVFAHSVASPMSESAVAAALPPPSKTALPSKRLRHKQINFLELLKGEDGSSQASPALTETVDPDKQSLEGSASGKGVITTGRKHGASKDLNVNPSKRRRKDKCKPLDPKKKVASISPDCASKTMISEDKDSCMPIAKTKNKKRCLGLSTSAKPSHSLKSKLGPIKVNVRSLIHFRPSKKCQPRRKELFGRKSKLNANESSAKAADHLQRVLRVSHLNAVADSAPNSMPPIADVHLDLFQQPDSCCMLCLVCKTYMSVVDFLKHQHMNGTQQLVKVTRKRTLVPLNQENMTVEEQKMWLEFQSLCSNIYLSPVGCSYVSLGRVQEEMRSPPDVDIQDKCTTEVLDGIQNSEVLEAGDPHVSLVSCSSENQNVNITLQEMPLQAESSSSPPSSHLFLNHLIPGTHTKRKDKFSNNAALTASRPSPFSQETSVLKRQNSVQRPRKLSAHSANIRTSSRQRKSKRFFGCENYEFTAGGKRNYQTNEDDCHDADVDVLFSKGKNSSTTNYSVTAESVITDNEQESG